MGSLCTCKGLYKQQDRRWNIKCNEGGHESSIRCDGVKRLNPTSDIKILNDVGGQPNERLAY